MNKLRPLLAGFIGALIATALALLALTAYKDHQLCDQIRAAQAEQQQRDANLIRQYQQSQQKPQ